MTKFLAGRVVAAAISLLVLATVAFFSIHILLPYDWSTQFALGNVAGARALYEELGLGRPLIIQWGEYITQLVRFDLGTGFDGGSVTDRVLRALPVTMTVFAVGGLIAYMLGQWLGRFVAWQRSKAISGATTAVSLLLLTSFPPLLLFLINYFWGGTINDARVALGFDMVPMGRIPEGSTTTILSLALIVTLGIAIGGQAAGRRIGRPIVGILALPVALSGMALAFALLGMGREVVDLLLRPSLIIALVAFIAVAFGEVMLVMRTGMTAEKPEDYVATARAKGLRPRWVRDRHVSPNAVIPALSRFFAGIPFLLTGLIIVERQLGLDGLSSVFFNGIEHANVPLVVGTLVMIGVMVTILRLVLDVLHAVIDPRLRLTASAA